VIVIMITEYLSCYYEEQSITHVISIRNTMTTLFIKLNLF